MGFRRSQIPFSGNSSAQGIPSRAKLLGPLRDGTGDVMKLLSKRQKGFSLIELLIVVTIILIISAIAIPNLVRNKIQANETAAVGAMRALTESSLLYSNSYGGFPHALSDLGPASGGTAASSAAADLIDSVLASGIKGGYNCLLYTSDAADDLL